MKVTAELAAVTLVLGGARSGKSRYAESLIESQLLKRIYLATGTAGDGEMAERIARHRDRRGARWRTVEEPLNLMAALRREAAADTVVLVDCLTLWLANLIFAKRDVDRAAAELVQGLPDLPGPVVFVSNEVGLGIVPEHALSREFRDRAGLLHQAIAAAAQVVVLMVAGLPHSLKSLR